MNRLYDLGRQIISRWPPIDPPGCHWLNSDATFSYCWACAREAAWRELPTIGPAPVETDWWKRDPQEQLIRDRIDGPQSSESDGPQSCETCGCTLEYTLTDYGCRDELDHFSENPPTPETMNAEISHALYQAFICIDWDGADPDLIATGVTIAEACLGIAVEQGVLA